MENNIIPIALFAYARPNHLFQTLEGLKKNNVPLIYAFCDGAKDESKVEEVKKVSEIIKAVNWTEVIISERDTNWGLGTSIRAGVTEVLQKHDKVIVIEDDIVMRPGAYEYTCAALNYYEKDDRVMTISMWTHPIITSRKMINGFLSERFVCWGWGTYKWAWKLYEGSPKEVYEKCVNKNIKPEEWGKDILWQVENSEKRNLWYVGYVLTHFLHEKLSFFPPYPLVINIGRDATGMNTSGGKQDDISFQNIPINQYSNIPVQLYPSVKKKFRKYFEKRKSWGQYIKEYVYKKFYKRLIS